MPGVYAVKVTGIVSHIDPLAALSCLRYLVFRTLLTRLVTQLPEDIIQTLEDAGVKYIPYATLYQFR